MAQQDTFLTVLEAGEARIEVPRCDEGLLPGLQISVFLSYPHKAERNLSCVSSYKGTNPIREVPTLMTELPLNAPPPNTISLGVRIST